MHLSASSIFRAPLSALLEYSGILRSRSSDNHPHNHTTFLNTSGVSRSYRDHLQSRLVLFDPTPSPAVPASPNISNGSGGAAAGGEVSIRIIGSGEQDHLDRVSTPLPSPTAAPTPAVLRGGDAPNGVFLQSISRTPSAVSLEGQGDQGVRLGISDGIPHPTTTTLHIEAGDVPGTSNRDSSYQRYDIQQAARWIEQVLPFSLLLLVVFIRQHLQGNMFPFFICF